MLTCAAASLLVGIVRSVTPTHRFGWLQKSVLPFFRQLEKPVACRRNDLLLNGTRFRHPPLAAIALPGELAASSYLAQASNVGFMQG